MIIDEIVENKKKELERIAPYKGYYMDGFKDKIGRIDPPRDFPAALAARGPEDVRIIAEVKKASPSKGIIRPEFYPMVIAQAYQANGAAAVSILTEEKYFLGRLDFLTSIKHHLKIPVLRKDFIVEDYQVWESRAAGADALLLIASVLEGGLLSDLLGRTGELGMTALVEVHDEKDLRRALDAGAGDAGAGGGMIGINNRDLKTFTTDLETTKRLAPLVPEGCVVVSESGINTFDDIVFLREAGAGAFLVGEALVREDDVGAKLKELRGVRTIRPEDLGYEPEEGGKNDPWKSPTD